MKTKTLRSLILLLFISGIMTTAIAQKMDRTILPIQPPHLEPITVLDARDAEKPPTFE